MDNDTKQRFHDLVREISEELDSAITLIVIGQDNSVSAISYGCPACLVEAMKTYVNAHTKDKHTSSHRTIQ